MSKTKDALSHEIFKPREWGRPTKAHNLPRPWFGLDTERDANNGIFVCGFAEGPESIPFETITDLPKGTYWVWNLPYDIEGMIRDLRQENGWAMKSDGAPFTINDAKCVYYHGKRFDWQDKDGKRIFLEASSFFGRKSLDVMARTVLKDKKLGGIKASEMSLSRYNTDKEYRATVQEYCRHDARLVMDAVEALNVGCTQAGKEMGLPVTLGGTPGATARRFLSAVGAFPDILWRTHSTFLRAYCGGRFEIVKRGVLPDVYQYDIVSAYPWALSQCPFITANARHRFTRTFSDDAIYGAYEVSFKLDGYLGLAPRWRDNTRVFSAQEEKTWLSKPEIEWLHMNNFDYTVHRGCEIIDESATDTWAKVVSSLFALKQKAREEPSGMGAKIVLNSLYGVLIQLTPRGGKWVPIGDCIDPVDLAGDLALEKGPKAFDGGKYYAPAYAAHLTALTRVKLLEASLSVGDGYIGGHTDSILSTKPLRGLGHGLGDWEMVQPANGKETADQLIITKTGVYAMDDKVKLRGIDRNLPKSALWQKYQTRKTRVSVKRARSWDEVSLIQNKVVANNLDYEHKRNWDAPFSSSVIRRKQFIDSEPLRNVMK